MLSSLQYAEPKTCEKITHTRSFPYKSGNVPIVCSPIPSASDANDRRHARRHSYTGCVTGIAKLSPIVEVQRVARLPVRRDMPQDGCDLLPAVPSERSAHAFPHWLCHDEKSEQNASESRHGLRLAQEDVHTGGHQECEARHKKSDLPPAERKLVGCGGRPGEREPQENEAEPLRAASDQDYRAEHASEQGSTGYRDAEGATIEAVSERV